MAEFKNVEKTTTIEKSEPLKRVMYSSYKAFHVNVVQPIRL